ncbi:hypothetical protein YQ44_01655 [Janthinobacterium sp. 1_2014MBL_MicDiv]|nr:hypothetical protein YQ44_01655 [Janthinobacterium sp. 1_2014MBL_MicDiv]
MASGQRQWQYKVKREGKPVKRPKAKKAAEAAFSLVAEAAFFAAERQKLACCDCGFRTNGTELLTELLDATSGIDDFVLAREEWVRFSRNLDLHQWVFFTVVGDFFAGLDGRAGNEFEIARQIVENNFAVFWMGIDFHGILSK